MRSRIKSIEAQRDALGRTLLGLAVKHNKPYIWATEETIRLFMAKYHNCNVSPRTLRRRIAEFVSDGFIIRQLRTMPDGNGGRRFTSSLTFIKRKLFEWVERMERFARKVFSFFRRPNLAPYSSYNPRRDLKKAYGIVEILWKFPYEGRASPSKAF